VYITRCFLSAFYINKKIIAIHGLEAPCYVFIMKNTLLFITLLFGIFSCKNTSENTPPKEKTNMENTTTKAAQNTSSESDIKWLKIGYDLEKIRPTGLKVGMKAPDFTLKAPNGTTVKLSEELKKQPVVLMFYRGQWCPICTRYLAEFQKSVPQIAAKGAKIIAITPETNQGIAKTVEKTKIDFTVLNDINESVMSSYKVLFSVTDEYQERIRKGKEIDIAMNNGKTMAQLPVPATYVIGQDGIIKFVQFDLNYKNRASVADIVKHL